VQREIAETHPRLAQSIARSYPQDASISDLLAAVERRRRKRRLVCREEVADLREYRGWIEEFFGANSTCEIEHALGFSHQRFHLLVARKSPT
jgi:hypothetical protein